MNLAKFLEHVLVKSDCSDVRAASSCLIKALANCSGQVAGGISSGGHRIESGGRWHRWMLRGWRRGCHHGVLIVVVSCVLVVLALQVYTVWMVRLVPQGRERAGQIDPDPDYTTRLSWDTVWDSTARQDATGHSRQGATVQIRQCAIGQNRQGATGQIRQCATGQNRQGAPALPPAR